VLLLSSEQDELGTLRLDVPVTISPLASGAGHPSVPQKRTTLDKHPAPDFDLPLRSDRTYMLNDLLKAVAVSGADDAALAVAEAISGSVPECLESMNARAARLGMTATHFGSLGSLKPDVKAEDHTSARDVARLARALSGYGKVLEWTSLSGLPFDDGATLLRNRNPLISSVPGVDGMHVGLSSRAGAPAVNAAVVTALRGQLRLIAVVLDASDRAAELSVAADLLEWGFASFERVELVQQGEKLNLSVDVDGGVQEQVTPVAGATFAVVRRRGEERSFQVRYQLPSTVTAPVDRQQEIGEIIVEEKGGVLAVIPALAPGPVPAAGVLSAALR